MCPLEQVLNAIYGSVAIALNDYENHRTDTQYEDALIAKTFIFQYVNSFASLFYISFVKPYMQVRCDCCACVSYKCGQKKLLTARYLFVVPHLRCCSPVLCGVVCMLCCA
jgi:hypothetical protein